MSLNPYKTIRCLILVKAYPQPSTKYQETVCVAAISEDGRHFLRLYPIRYRHLEDHQKFGRFDLVEMRVAKADNDPRPESYKVDEQSIKILIPSNKTTPESRATLWQGLVGLSLTEIKEIQQRTNKSLGIIKPDSDTLTFHYQKISESDNSEELAILKEIRSQTSLFESNEVKILEPIEYLFKLKFQSNGTNHNMQIHDWEVQQTFRNFKRKYNGTQGALEKMTQFYNTELPAMNPHFIVGNLNSRPYQFMLIGILRSRSQGAFQQTNLSF